MTESTGSEAKSEQTSSAHAHECGCHGKGPEFTRVFTKIFEPPAGVGEHFRQARIEFLKGIRALIDHRIDRLSRAQKGTRITVE
jgi:hypothetical protein